MCDVWGVILTYTGSHVAMTNIVSVHLYAVTSASVL